MKTKKVQLNLYIPEAYKTILGRMAGERMLRNPSKSASASQIGAEIICEYLDSLGETERSNKK
jgi:hypothetical protein